MIVMVSETDFGNDVADYLAGQGEVIRLTLEHALSREWMSSTTPFVGIALSGGAPVKLEQLTQKLQHAGIPHSCALLSDHMLQCGPLVVPGKTACFQCAAKRLLSLVETPRTAMLEFNLQRYHERQPQNALRGYTPALVIMAALRLQQHASLPIDQLGKLTAISFSNNRSASTCVVPLHGCTCRGTRHLSQAQGTAMLVESLKGALR